MRGESRRYALYIGGRELSILALILFAALLAFASTAAPSDHHSELRSAARCHSNDASKSNAADVSSSPTINPAPNPLSAPSPTPSKRPFVVAIMALWDEALTLPLAIDSSRHFVDEYFVIHKVGTDNTADVLRKCQEKWSLRVQYMASNMTLRNARMHVIRATRDYADLYLVQDGDEIMYHRGPTALSAAFSLIYGAGYNMIQGKQVYLKHNLVSTYKDSYTPGGQFKWGGHPANGIMLIPHPVVFRNIPEQIYFPEAINQDEPGIRGSEILTHDPWKFDVSVKHPLREYLRGFWLGWTEAGSPGRIEEWVAAHDSNFIAAAATNANWTLLDSALVLVEHQAAEWLAPYKESEWHTYPDAIKVYIDAGRLRGYDGGEILSVELNEMELNAYKRPRL